MGYRMRWTATRLSAIFAIVVAAGCLSEPLLKSPIPTLRDDSPMRFQGFQPLPSGEGRVLIFRRHNMMDSPDEGHVRATDCEFQLYGNHFGVCRYGIQRVDIAAGPKLGSVDIKGGDWHCAEYTPLVKVIQWVPCERMKRTLQFGAKEVWTTQMDLAERYIHIPKRPRKKGAMRR